MIHKNLWLFGLLIFLTACGAPKTTTPAPTPEAITIYYPASLQPWADKFSDCSTSFPQVALYFVQTTTSNSGMSPGDIQLEYGQSTHSQGENSYLAQVGYEQVVVIINASNPISELDSSQLRQIFLGKALNWEAGTGKPIQVWVLPESDSTRQIFDDALNLSQLLAPDARLAPDPQAMLNAVSENEAAIGFLPRSFLSANKYSGVDFVKMITLDISLEQGLDQPVVTFTQGEPRGFTRGLIACLQNSETR